MFVCVGVCLCLCVQGKTYPFKGSFPPMWNPLAFMGYMILWRAMNEMVKEVRGQVPEVQETTCRVWRSCRRLASWSSSRTRDRTSVSATPLCSSSCSLELKLNGCSPVPVTQHSKTSLENIQSNIQS